MGTLGFLDLAQLIADGNSEPPGLRRALRALRYQNSRLLFAGQRISSSAHGCRLSPNPVCAFMLAYKRGLDGLNTWIAIAAAVIGSSICGLGPTSPFYLAAFFLRGAASAYSMMSVATTPMGSLRAGVIAEHAGPRTTLAFDAAICVIAAFVCVSPS